MGRLGIITRVKLAIVPQQAVRRSVSLMTIEEFAAQIKTVQDAYNAALATGSAEAIAGALHPLDTTQVWKTVHLATLSLPAASPHLPYLQRAKPCVIVLVCCSTLGRMIWGAAK